jgi:Protein of unknown function (DUF3311)
MKRTMLYVLLIVLFLLHQDFWLWNDSTLLLGFLPLGLAYHAAFCVATSLLMYLLVTRCWPDEAEAFAEGDPDDEAAQE